MQHCCNAVEILFFLNDAILKLFIVLKNMISPMRYSHFLFYWKLLGWKGIFIVYKCTSVTPLSKVHKLMLLDCPRFKQTFITCYKFLFTCLIFREYKPAGYNFWSISHYYFFIVQPWLARWHAELACGSSGFFVFVFYLRFGLLNLVVNNFLHLQIVGSHRDLHSSVSYNKNIISNHTLF